jgi:hypothetical protein
LNQPPRASPWEATFGLETACDKKHDSNGMTTHNPKVIFDHQGAITIPTRVQIQNRKGSINGTALEGFFRLDLFHGCWNESNYYSARGLVNA